MGVDRRADKQKRTEIVSCSETVNHRGVGSPDFGHGQILLTPGHLGGTGNEKCISFHCSF